MAHTLFLSLFVSQSGHKRMENGGKYDRIRSKSSLSSNKAHSPVNSIGLHLNRIVSGGQRVCSYYIILFPIVKKICIGLFPSR